MNVIPLQRDAPPATGVAEFLAELDGVRKDYGLSYTQIGHRAGKGMSRSTAHAMINGDRLPPRRHVELFLRACRVPKPELERLLMTWTRRNAAETAEPPPAPPLLRAVADPAPVADPVPARPTFSLVRAVVAVSALVVVICGSTVAMWLVAVPTELMIMAYGLVLVCVGAWTAVARTMVAPAQRTRAAPAEPAPGYRATDDLADELYDDLPAAYPPVFGG